MKLYSRVLVGLISSNIWAVDFLPKYPYDADEQNKVHLWRYESSERVLYKVLVVKEISIAGEV